MFLPSHFLFFLFVINTVLTSLFFVQITTLWSKARALRMRYGLSGSAVSVFSVGCTACGFLITPITLMSTLGIPLFALHQLNILLGLLACIFLCIGNYFVYKDVQMILYKVH